MSRSSSILSPTVLRIFLLSLALFAGLSACTTPQKEAAESLIGAVNSSVDQALEEPSELVFAGQIESVDDEWQNGYVVVLFEDGEEVKRTTSRLLDSSFSGDGPMDGVFELRIPNKYALNLAHEFYHPNRTPVSMQLIPGLVGTRSIGTWFDNLHPGDLTVVSIPEKQVDYALVVLKYTEASLPESHQTGRLSLDGGILVTNKEDAVGDESIAWQATAVPNPTPTPQVNIQFTVLPDSNGGLAWNLQMTGYHGTRWEVWQRFLAGRVTGIDWETFKMSVLVHNPQLEGDGYVFYPEKSYRLPLLNQ